MCKSCYLPLSFFTREKLLDVLSLPINPILYLHDILILVFFKEGIRKD